MSWMWLIGIALAGSELRPVGPGSYTPLYTADSDNPVVTVASFLLEEKPVTRGEFAAFIAEHPKWRRDTISRTFADKGYLDTWIDPLTPNGSPEQPVVQVSWFAARAYCKAAGRRLPTEDEWEVAALADETRADASQDPARAAAVLAWYGSANSERAVGERPPNIWGVHDLHGLVWEWVDNFNSTLYGTDPRESGDEAQNRFCGAGALTSADARDYATFMRVAFRTSLEANYSTKNLGFRCASDLPEAP